MSKNHEGSKGNRHSRQFKNLLTRSKAGSHKRSMAENTNNFESCVKRAGKEEASGFEACLMTEADNKGKESSGKLNSVKFTLAI
jgi:hypothetical protein